MPQFSTYDMLITKIRKETIEYARSLDQPVLVGRIKKWTDRELIAFDKNQERMTAMFYALALDGLASLNTSQYELLEKPDTLDDVFQRGMQAARENGEIIWKELGRPYYNVWPGMVEPLERCSLQGVRGSHVELPVQALLIRLPEPQGTIFYFKHDKITFLWQYGKANGMTTFSLETFLEANQNISEDSIDFVERSATDKMVSVVTGIALLRGNKDIIEPIPLNADEFKYARTLDPKLIEKAKKKGTFGFNVGRHVETAPGFRRAHFATRWKGVGRTRPELVPIKGCLVRRKLVTEVPTGYLDKEEVPQTENA